jgi:hypothetical protein
MRPQAPAMTCTGSKLPKPEPFNLCFRIFIVVLGYEYKRLPHCTRASRFINYMV